MKSIQTFLERFNCIPFEEKPQILFQTWETFFAIQCSQPEDSNELFQKLLKYLKELAKYDQSTSTDHPIFLNDNEDHHVQNKESPKNSSEETVVSKTNQEPPQDSDIHQLIEECSIKVREEQKQKMEDTMFELVKICQEKEFLCIHDDVDNLIESALDSKLILINSNSQRLDKKEKEVKNVVEQPAERGNRSIQSLQNFRVVHKSSISLNTSQISSVHEVTPILSTKEPGHSLSMGYEHLSITSETESDEVTESNAENLLPIPSKCEVTLEDEIKCDMPAQDVCSLVFTTFLNPLFKDDDNFDSSDDESLPDEDVPAEEFKIYSNPLFDEDEINSNKLDPHCFNVESDFVETLLNRDTFIDFSSKFDFSGELAHIKPETPKSDFDFQEEILLIENLLYDNSFPRPPEELNAEIADTIIESIPLPIPVQDGNSQQEEIDIVTETDDVLPPSVENNDDDYDLLLEEVDLFLSDNSILPGIENVDPEGDIRFLEELLIDDSILSDELSDANFKENPLIPRPPPELPDAEIDAGKEIAVVMNDKDKFDNDSQIFMFDKVFSLLSAESEDTIFDPETSYEVFQANHSIQNEESFENISNQIAISNSNQEKEEPSQESDIHQLIEECSIEICEEQKQSMEDTMLELIEVCRQKEFYCMHDNVDDLIESALNSRLLSINLESQRPDKKKQEVKNVMEQPTKRETRIAKSLQNFRVIHKTSSISLNNTSQFSLVHAIAPIFPTEEPEYSLSMGYEHLSTILEMKSDKVLESSAKNLLPIPSEYEVTFDDEKEFKVYSNPFFDAEEINSDEIDAHCFNVESDFVKSLSNRDTLNDSSLKFYFLDEFSGALSPTSIANEERIRREHAEFISLMERLFTINPCPHPMENSNAIVETLPTSPILIEDSDSQTDEIDIFTGMDNLLPPSFESDDDLEGESYVLEELLIDDSISLPENELFYFDHQDDLSFPRPPPEPPDVFFDLEPDFREEISAVMINIEELIDDECFNP
nr:hypothetical protein [Tanacetum cinerariifolium]